MTDWSGCPETAIPSQSSHFKYVLIPADTEQPFQEFRLPAPADMTELISCLMNAVKKYFREQGTKENRAEKVKNLKKMLSEQGQDMSKFSDEQLDFFSSNQMCGQLPILPRAKGRHPSGKPGWSGYRVISLYSDDNAVANGGQANPRATNMAAMCGTTMQGPIVGDCFLAHLFDDDDAFVREDFTLDDCTPDAKWIVEARKRHKANGGSSQQQPKIIQVPKNANLKLKSTPEPTATFEKYEGKLAGLKKTSAMNGVRVEVFGELDDGKGGKRLKVRMLDGEQKGKSFAPRAGNVERIQK